MEAPVAFLFPGQGSQIIGMGASLASESKSAKLVFEQVNEALSEDLFSIMREGPKDILRFMTIVIDVVEENPSVMMQTKPERPRSEKTERQVSQNHAEINNELPAEGAVSYTHLRAHET